MALLSSPLGRLAKLPRELRQVIYEELMPWNRNHTSKERWRIEDTLPILRLSKRLSEEATPLIYRGWIPTFKIDPEIASLGKPAAGDLHIEVEMKHDRYPTYRVRLAKATAVPFRNAAYHRFQTIRILLKPVVSDSKSSLRDTFQAMKLLVECLKTRRDQLPPITVFARNSKTKHWYYQGETNYPLANLSAPHYVEVINNPIRSIVANGQTCGWAGGNTDLHILLGPLGVLKKPITLVTSRRIKSFNFVDSSVTNVYIDDSDEEVSVVLDPAKVPRKADTEQAFFISILGDHVQLIRMQALVAMLGLIHLDEELRIWHDTSRLRELILGIAPCKVHFIRRFMFGRLAKAWARENRRQAQAKGYTVITSKRIYATNEEPPQPLDGPLQIQDLIDEIPLEQQAEVTLYVE